MMMASGSSVRFVHSVLTVVALALPMMAVAAETDSAADRETVALGIEGISSTSGEDNPGILYILPWQPPTLPRRTREGLDANASELLEPMDPVVFQRHQDFQKSLNPAVDSTRNLR